MAESAVSSLLIKLDSLFAEEVNLLRGVSTEVRQIKDELQRLRAFLRDTDADGKAESEDGAKEWVAQVREAAYDIEDVLDEYELRLVQPPIHHGHVAKFFLHKTRDFIKHQKKRHRIASQIQELRARIIDISFRKESYGFKMIEQGSSSSNAPADRASHLTSAPLFVDEADLFEEADIPGVENPKNKLIGLLVDGEPRLTVISVVGMGGLGKTTLVGKVYSSKEVKAHFEAFAWVTVSYTLRLEEVFRSMLQKFCGGRIEPLYAMGKEELIEELRSHLMQKRYVIVLDDLWAVDDWECIRIGLPNGECGSRILVTTRNSQVAAACSEISDHVYDLQPLPLEQRWTLFCKTAFRSEFGGICPPHLESLSKKIVQNCGGLPLAIVAIGNLLRTRPKTVEEWHKLYDSLVHEIGGSSSFTGINRIILSSYQDLPYFLKPCFMYVSIFPKDYLIRPARLIQLWIAEGFVERNEDMTLEEVADDYLHELIHRSLIQVVSYTDYGTIKACRMHDIVRDIILSKAREEKFMTILNGTELSDNTRRLVLHYSGEVVPRNDLSRVRTFVIFGKVTWPDSLMNAWYSGFRLLKVLDLEGTGIDIFPSEIVNLLHLRFLSLRNTRIAALPESIGKLTKLETLDLLGTYCWELPASIVKLKYLRHLLARSSMKGAMVTHGVGSLTSLQQLGYLKSDQGSGVVIGELGKLTQLKWLGITDLTSEDGLNLCASIEKMTCLSSLSASSVMEGYGLLDLKYLSPPPLLKDVHLVGHLQALPQWVPSVSNLVHLTLKDSRLMEDPFSALQHLPNLMKLKLTGAYIGKELCCEGGGFQKLGSLSLFLLNGLKMVRVEKGAMPNLQKLRIRQCWELEKVPFGIEHLTHLKELHFYEAGEALRKSIERDVGEDHRKISHVPVIKIDDSWRALED